MCGCRSRCVHPLRASASPGIHTFTRIADAAVRAGATTAEAVRDLREFERRWPGSLRTEQVLRLLDPRREGWLESWSAAAFHRMQLPRWIPQVNVHDAHDRFLGRVDGYWPELGVAAEADGRGKYLGDVDPVLDRSPDAVAERVLAAGEREVGLRATGLGVVRWTTDEITKSPAPRQREVVGRGAPNRPARHPSDPDVHLLPSPRHLVRHRRGFLPSGCLEPHPSRTKSEVVGVLVGRGAVSRGGSGGRRLLLRRGRHPGRSAATR